MIKRVSGVMTLKTGNIHHTMHPSLPWQNAE